jgi:hypothetical protein
MTLSGLAVCERFGTRRWDHSESYIIVESILTKSILFQKCETRPVKLVFITKGSKVVNNTNQQ